MHSKLFLHKRPSWVFMSKQVWIYVAVLIPHRKDKQNVALRWNQTKLSLFVEISSAHGQFFWLHSADSRVLKGGGLSELSVHILLRVDRQLRWTLSVQTHKELRFWPRTEEVIFLLTITIENILEQTRPTKSSNTRTRESNTSSIRPPKSFCGDMRMTLNDGALLLNSRTLCTSTTECNQSINRNRINPDSTLRTDHSGLLPWQVHQNKCPFSPFGNKSASQRWGHAAIKAWGREGI